jgi:hypothetical protein
VQHRPQNSCGYFPARAQTLADAAKSTFGLASRAIACAGLPFADRVSRNWLERTANPYRNEIAELASLLDIRGVWFLNICFEWGCTTGVWDTADGPVLRRVLDWPFPKLGETIVVARQSASISGARHHRSRDRALRRCAVGRARLRRDLQQGAVAAPSRRHAARLFRHRNLAPAHRRQSRPTQRVEKLHNALTEEFGRMNMAITTSAAIATERANRLREAVKRLHVRLSGKTLSLVTLSAGVATFPGNGSIGMAVVAEADASSNDGAAQSAAAG